MHFNEATEAEVYLTEGCYNSQRSVVKYTYPVVVLDYRDLKPGDTIAWHYPNEARALLYHLKPHPGIVQLLEVNADVEPGRFMMRFAYCNGGDLVDQIDYTCRDRQLTHQEPFVLHVLIEMTDILAYVHHGLIHIGNGKYKQDPDHKPMIHGDVKEDNTFLSWDTLAATKSGLPSIVLGDWGTAVVAGTTNNKIGPGTWIYHAPEDLDLYDGKSFKNHMTPLYRHFINSRTCAVDMYALGHIMYKLCANESTNWTIGKDPGELRICGEYKTPGLKEAVMSLLAVDPTQRGEANFKEGVGLLPVIQKLRVARDEMLERRGRPDLADWREPPKEKKKSKHPIWT